MNVDAAQLARRRRTLQLRCQQQRHQVAQLSANIESRLSLVDRVVGATAKFVTRPALILGGLAAIVVIGRWRILRWLSRGAVLFATARKVQNLLSKH